MKSEYWMKRCLALAANADSSVSPNPRVGCVIVSSDGKILGEGWHQYYGGPHAEVNAINQVLNKHGKSALRDSLLIVNLEPCHHQGKTPPCTEAITKYGISHVIIGMRDPNHVASGGANYLQDTPKITTMIGVLEDECYRFNEAFALWQIRKRPFVTLKLAQTLDGCIATTSGKSKWITSKTARTRVHVMRKETDAILIGAGTAVADNPNLTVRHVSGCQPLRIILDRQGKLSPKLNVFSDPMASKTIAIVGKGQRPTYRDQLFNLGGQVMEVHTDSEHINLDALMDLLGSRLQVQSLLVEAGPKLASALIIQDLVDRLQLFIAPKLIGNGLRPFHGLNIRTLTDSVKFNTHSWESLGTDMLFTGHKRPIIEKNLNTQESMLAKVKSESPC